MSEASDSPAVSVCDADAAKEVGRVQWWIDTVVANADALRAAGVSTIGVGAYSASLLPKPPELPKYDDVKNDELPDDLPALIDPRSYPGGVVPGYRIEKLPAEE